MKKQPLILVAFLLVLFIVPMSFANVAAIEYEASSHSVTSFSETTDDNVLFAPDAIQPKITDGNVSGAETNHFNATFVNDATTWNNLDTDSALYTYFDIDGSFPVDTMYLTIDAIAGGPISTHVLSLYLYNPQGTDLLVDLHNGVGAGVDAVLSGQYTITAWNYYEYNSKHTFYLHHASSVNPTNIQVDYFTLSFMTFANNAEPVQSNTYFATGGDAGYVNTSAVDSANFSITDGAGTLEFSYPTSNISLLVSFTYAIYGTAIGSFPVSYSSDDIYYGTGPFDVISSVGWYNGTATAEDLGSLENTGIGYVFFGTPTFPICDIDYMELSYTYIPVSSYGECFTYVNDWTEESNSAGACSFTSDGDVLDFSLTFEDAGNELAVYESNVSFTIPTDGYIEFRYKIDNEDKINGYIRMHDGTNLISLSAELDSEEWETFKYSEADITDPDYDIGESLVFWIYLDDAPAATDDGPYHLYIDYLRVGYTNEAGWQHDGSTTIGVGLESNVDSLTSDGDILTMIGSGPSSAFYDIENLDIDLNYYPFFEMRWLAPLGQQPQILFHDWDGTQVPSGALTETGDWQITRLNVDALITDGSIMQFMYVFDGLNGAQNISIDYIKFYSIADFTVTQGNCEIEDLIFVDSGALNCSNLITDGNEYIRLNYDPLLSVDTSTYTIVNITTDCTDDALEFYFKEYVDGAWRSATDDISRLLVTGTMTDYWFQFNGKSGASLSRQISAVTFYGVVPYWQVVNDISLVFFVSGWHIINSVILVFVIELSTYSLNLFFLFLGLAMIPLSTIYLVKGGKAGMSMDKVFFGTVVFIFGWALFLGGIFG